MKWTYAIAAIVLFAATAFAEEIDEEGEARLGFISVSQNGATSLTFNATSIQNAVILGLFLLVLGALLLPLLGVDMTEEETGYGSGYSYEQSGYSTGYSEPSSPGYNGFAKRSARDANYVYAAISKAEEQYTN